ncbi:MAG: ABC1 kinase family protein [Chloroflexota bacterium]
MRTFLRHPRRVSRVLAVLFRRFVWPALPLHGKPAETGPERMRLALEELGGAWIKLGQMLAMRFDLLPPAYCDELFKLLNQVRPFAYPQVRQIIERELGEPPETVFREFEEQSFAAASIGQVHRAVLQSGDRVAVKVQRPNIRESMQADIDLMYAVGGLIDFLRLFGATHSRAVIDEFARWTADELDYLVEARQAVLLYEHARGERLERIAKVYRDYTTSRVLTTELIEGVPVIEIIRATREGNRAYLRSLADAGYDLDRIARHLDWNMLNQVYVYGYFHADLHPANLFVLPGDAIGYVDYGIVGQLPDGVRQSLIRYSWLLFGGDVDNAIGELMRWLAPTAGTDPALARRQLVNAHQAFIYEMSGISEGDRSERRNRERPRDNPYSKLAVDIMKTIRLNHLTLSSSVVAYLKMLVMLGTLRHELAMDYDLSSNVRRFFSRLMRQQTVGWLDPRLAMDRLYAGTVRLRRASDLLEFLEDQQPVILEAERSLFGFRRRLRRATRRLLAIGAAVLLVGSALFAILEDPQGARRVLPAQMSYDSIHLGLVILLVVSIVWLIAEVRRFARVD